MTVPLSEHEQKILQEIERDLYKEDPGFAREVRRGDRWPEARRARLGALAFVAGFCILIAFFALQSAKFRAWSLFLGVVAFGAMVGGIVLVAGSFKSLAARPAKPQEPQPRERLADALRRLQQRLRDRYRGS